MKLILSRDVFFLEMNKNDEIVERHLNCMANFSHVNTYHEFSNEIPHLEWGIPILVQSFKSPFIGPSLPHGKFLPLRPNMMFNWMM